MRRGREGEGVEGDFWHEFSPSPSSLYVLAWCASLAFLVEAGVGGGGGRGKGGWRGWLT